MDVVESSAGQLATSRAVQQPTTGWRTRWLTAAPAAQFASPSPSDATTAGTAGSSSAKSKWITHFPAWLLFPFFPSFYFYLEWMVYQVYTSFLQHISTCWNTCQWYMILCNNRCNVHLAYILLWRFLMECLFNFSSSINSELNVLGLSCELKTLMALKCFVIKTICFVNFLSFISSTNRGSSVILSVHVSTGWYSYDYVISVMQTVSRCTCL